MDGTVECSHGGTRRLACHRILIWHTFDRLRLGLTTTAENNNNQSLLLCFASSRRKRLILFFFPGVAGSELEPAADT